MVMVIVIVTEMWYLYVSDMMMMTPLEVVMPRAMTMVRVTVLRTVIANVMLWVRSMAMEMLMIVPRWCDK